MANTKHTLVYKLQDEGEKIHLFFSSMTPDQWQQVVYTGKVEWRVRDVLAHFISVENSLQSLIGDIRAGGAGAPEGFSIDEFNNALVTQLKTVEPVGLLAAFCKENSSMLECVLNLSETDLEKRGNHPFQGMTSIAEIIRMTYIHNRIHVRDVKKALTAHS